MNEKYDLDGFRRKYDFAKNMSDKDILSAIEKVKKTNEQKYDLDGFRRKYDFAKNMSDKDILDNIDRVKKSNKEPEQESFSGKLSRYSKDALSGVLKGAEGVINTPYNLNQLLKGGRLNALANAGDYLIPHIQERDYAKILGQNKDEMSDKFLQGLGEFGGAVFVPEANLGSAGEILALKGGKIGEILKSALGNSLSQGAYSATQSKDPIKGAAYGAEESLPIGIAGAMAQSISPSAKAVGKAGVSILSGLAAKKIADESGLDPYVSDLIGLAAGAAPKLFSNQESKARKDFLEKVDYSEIKDTLDASRRLGLDFITPGEATQNPLIGKKEGRLGVNNENAQREIDAFDTRDIGQRKKIMEILDAISPSKEAHKPFYKASENSEIPVEKIKELKDSSEIIKKAFDSVKNDDVFGEVLKDTPENKFKFLQKVDEHLQDEVKNNISSGNIFKSKIIDSKRKKLTKLMSDIDPNYNEGKRLVALQKTREAIENKMKLNEYEPKSFYQKVLKNQVEYDKLKQRVSYLPEKERDQVLQTLEDMRNIYPKLYGIKNAKAGKQLESTGMNLNKNTVDKLMDMIKNHFIGEKYDRKALDIVLSPNWEKDISKLKERKLSEKNALSKKIISKILKSPYSFSDYEASNRSNN